MGIVGKGEVRGWKGRGGITKDTMHIPSDQQPQGTLHSFTSKIHVPTCAQVAHK